MVAARSWAARDGGMSNGYKVSIWKDEEFWVLVAHNMNVVNSTNCTL